MDEHGLPIVGAGVDYRKIPSLEHRTTLTMLNKFLAQTTSFLNRFSSVCEERLSDLSTRIQKLDISLCILESKLQSIEGLEGIQATTSYNPPAALADLGPVPSASPDQQQSQQQQQTSAPSGGGAGPPPPPSEGPVAPVAPEQPKEENVMKIKDDPRFAKFFKMKRLGVNPLQIAMEMRKAGFNPDLLEDEDAPAPQGGGGGSGAVGGVSNDSSDSSDSNESSSEEEESDDSFSD